MIDSLLDLLFPAECVLCGEGVRRWANGALCTACLGQFAPQVRPFCDRCGLPAPGIDGLCGRCLTGQTRYEFGRAALVLDDTLRQVIHHFKYNDRVSLSRPLGQALRTCLESESFSARTVVPVPLHRRRLRQRGYNQAALLASRLPLPIESRLLVRGRDTPSQTGLGRFERQRNVRGAFRCRRAVEGAVLVVDDVQTTGATINEVARVLKANGASRVEVLTLARIPSEGARL